MVGATSRYKEVHKVSQLDTTGYDGVLMGAIGKSSKTEVRIGIKQFQQNTFIDIRMYYLKGSQWFPTKKGITLPVETYPELDTVVSTMGEALGFRAGNSDE